MSKISQFKIRKPKNSKTSQNVLLKNPQNSIRKNVSLGFTMKWNPKSSHKINPHQSIMRKPIAIKKEKKRTNKKKEAKIKKIDNQQQKSHPQFSQIERKRERERVFVVPLLRFLRLQCMCSYCHYEFFSLFQRKKHELRRSSANKSFFWLL